MVGLRGVGKTVLLEQLRLDAERSGVLTIRIEAPENRSLPALLAPQLRLALLKLSRIQTAKKLAERALKALASFANSLKLKYEDIQVGFDFKPQPGLADIGDLEADLSSLLEEVGLAARGAKTAVVLFFDELQYLKRDEFAALISALHRCSQTRLPVTMVGAGLPQLPALAGNAKSYAERLFHYPQIGALTPQEAESAIVKPARDNGADYRRDAVAEIVKQTQGYPYFLQEWGKHSWDVARKSPITLLDVKAASTQAIAALDEEFLSRPIRSAHAEGEKLPAGHGGNGVRSAPFRRHCRPDQETDQRARPSPCVPDYERHDLESEPRRHSLHCAAVRQVHEEDHARKEMDARGMKNQSKQPSHSRCSWAQSDPLMRSITMRNGASPNTDSRALWEKLMLDGFQGRPLMAHDPAQARGLPQSLQELRSEAGRALYRSRH